MAAWTPPRTWTPGEIPTAAEFNADVRDNVLMLAAVAQDATLVDIVSSTTETDLIGTQGSGITIPGGTLQSASMLRISLLADLLNNTGAPHGGTLKLYWGGNLATGDLTVVTSDTNRWLVMGDLFVAEEGATNQAAWGGIVNLYNTALSPAQMMIPARNTTRAWSQTTVDGTVAQPLRVTWTPDLNSASLEFRKRLVTVEKVGNA